MIASPAAPAARPTVLLSTGSRGTSRLLPLPCYRPSGEHLGGSTRSSGGDSPQMVLPRDGPRAGSPAVPRAGGRTGQCSPAAEASIVEAPRPGDPGCQGNDY